jgi:hypothetical protein
VFHPGAVLEVSPKIPSETGMSISISPKPNHRMWNEEKKCGMLKKTLDKRT